MQANNYINFSSQSNTIIKKIIKFQFINIKLFCAKIILLNIQLILFELKTSMLNIEN